MRRSSPSVQFLAAAASSPNEAATMSSRPRYRGNRSHYRRGFADQSSGRGGGGGGGQFVTGDSHFQSVSDANRGFRSVERGNFDNRSAYQSHPRPHFNPRPHFSPPPYWNPAPPPFNPSPNYNRPPPFYQNQGFRPPQQFRQRPSKPLDYRDWESAKPGPPPHCERFTVLSYNILADYLALNHRSKLYFHIPRQMLAWEWRKRNIIFELGLWSADILCFQEVDKFQDLEEELKLRGYNGIWKMRTGDPDDGCAIFWRVSRFKLLHEECIEFNKLGLRDNVAQICVLESLKQNDNKDLSALPLSLAGSNKVVVCNIHVLYNPKRGEIKLGQIRVLLDKAYAISNLWDDAPVVLCGDFNCTPKSPLYNYIAEQKLNISDLPRDKLSGQASAEIRPPRQFSPNIRSQSVDSRGGPSAVVGHREHGQSGSPLYVHEQNCPESNSVNLPFTNSLSQPQGVVTGMHVYDVSSTSGICGNKNVTSSCETTNESHQEVDGCKDEIRSTISVPDRGLKENPSSQNKAGFFTGQMKDGHESMTAELNNCNMIDTGLTKETPQDTVDGCKDEFHSMVSVCSLENNASSPQNDGEVSGAQRQDGYALTLVDSHSEDLVETDHAEKLYATTDGQFDSSIEQSEQNLQTDIKIISCDKSKPSFLGSNDCTDAITDPIPSGASNSGISSADLFHDTSFPSTMKVSSKGNSENSSSASVANSKDNPSNLSKDRDSYELTCTDYAIPKKMENLSVEVLAETNDGDESLAEDSTNFLSELHGGSGPISSDFRHDVRSDFVKSDETFEEAATVPHSRDEVLDEDDSSMDSEPVDALKFWYDPSAWTPMEIETATGNADCILVEHRLKLRSTYAEVEDCSGTRDSNGEPLVTSYNRCFLGTVDYIWRSEGLQTVRVLAPIPKHAMQWTSGFPTKKWGSDHIALVSELAFVKDGSIPNA